MWDIEVMENRIQQVALDPTLWPDVLHDLSRQAGGVGAVLVSGSHQLPGPPVSSDVAPMLAAYYEQGWNTRDVRFRGVNLALRYGVVTDQDIVTVDEMRTLPYYRDWLERFDCRWFGGVGFTVAGEFWCLSIQRTVAQGPFDADEKRRLSTLCRPLREAGLLSHRLAFAHVKGMTDGLQHIRQPAVVLDERGGILQANEQADRILGSLANLKARALSFNDAQSQRDYDKLLARTMTKDPIEGPSEDIAIVRDLTGDRIKLQAVALKGWARYSFTQASILLLIERQEHSTVTADEKVRRILSHPYRLTPAETRLAVLLWEGSSVRDASDQLRITYHTARTQLKSIYVKLEVNRQGALIAMVNTLVNKFP